MPRFFFFLAGGSPDSPCSLSSFVDCVSVSLLGSLSSKLILLVARFEVFFKYLVLKYYAKKCGYF